MAPISAQTSPDPPKVTTIKALTDSSAAALKYIPPHYNYTTHPCENIGAATPSSDPQDTVPVIDFSLLTSTDSEQCSKVIQDLARACEEWGFFLVVNHSVAEILMKAVVDGLEEFFNLGEDC